MVPWERLLFRVALLGVVLCFGCKDPCRQLSEKLCDCALTTAERDACLQAAQAEDSRIGPTPVDNARCAQLLPGCDCHSADTAQGKIACGLARPPVIPDGG